MKTIAFFNNKGGVGKTSLVYHLAWMYADQGVKVIAADFDPQANLSSMFLKDDRLEQLWPDGEHTQTVLGAVRPLMRGIGDIAEPHVEGVASHIGLLVGDIGLSGFEDSLSSEWPKCLSGDERAFRITSAFHRTILKAAQQTGAELVLLDVGPNLGAINRTAIIAADHVVIPLAPDLYSLQGLKNLGPTLRKWREEWQKRLEQNPDATLPLPKGSMAPAGYVVMQHSVRADRPVKAYQKWIEQIPPTYRKVVLGETLTAPDVTVENDPHRLAMLKHYRSLMPMAQEARKPIFHLTPADGAIASHAQAAKDCGKDFLRLAKAIAKQCGVILIDDLL